MIHSATRVLVWAAALASSLAQSPVSRKQFDVAAVKLNTDNDGRFELGSYPGGNLTATGVTLKMLIMRAYRVHSFQVSGDPDWVHTEHWDIRAKAEGVAGRLPNDQFEEMLRALMEDRFQPMVHRETKTGLKGAYDFELHWTPEPGQGSPEAFGLPPVASDAPPLVGANGPSIFTALQEQLGLRLESQKGPVKILVIDHVEKASEN